MKLWSGVSIKKVWLWLVLSWFFCGLIATIAGFIGLFYPVLSVLLILPLSLIGVGIIVTITKIHSFSNIQKIIITSIGIWWLLHSLQVFVPETGFDALWYHLPLAKQTTSHHQFIGDLQFYQSFNPQFSDVIFYLGYAVAGEIGAKIIAYLFAITLIFTTYILSRIFLSKTFSLLTVLLVSSFQVVGWQSSSFYIDLAKAFWELSALILIIHKEQGSLAGLTFGASLASKVFSILLLPIKVVIAWLMSGKKYAIQFTVFSILIALPYYIFAYHISGNAFYSVFHHTEKIGEIGAAPSAISYSIQRTISLPKLFIEMVATREYTTLLIILFFPFLITFRKKIMKNKQLLALIIFSLYQILIWWYVPPTSSRYAVSGFITATIVVVYFLEKNSKYKKLIVLGLIIAGILTMPIRMIVAHRSWHYISGLQTREEYLQQFYDGNVDSVLKSWHQLN